MAAAVEKDPDYDEFDGTDEVDSDADVSCSSHADERILDMMYDVVRTESLA